ncbi:MAG: hypothetical protein PW788_10580 [Micavibrio sp.]|nr:hypothetical protein [Micavibrio sp.]
MPTFKKLDEYTLQATTEIPQAANEWGKPRLSRIFNFLSREVITLYERGGQTEYTQPGNGSYSSKSAFDSAVTSSMTVRSFSDLDSADEVIAMHARLTHLGGRPPKIDDITKEMPKLRLKRPGA